MVLLDMVALTQQTSIYLRLAVARGLRHGQKRRLNEVIFGEPDRQSRLSRILRDLKNVSADLAEYVADLGSEPPRDEPIAELLWNINHESLEKLSEDQIGLRIWCARCILQLIARMRPEQGYPTRPGRLGSALERINTLLVPHEPMAIQAMEELVAEDRRPGSLLAPDELPGSLALRQVLEHLTPDYTPSPSPGTVLRGLSKWPVCDHSLDPAIDFVDDTRIPPDDLRLLLGSLLERHEPEWSLYCELLLNGDLENASETIRYWLPPPAKLVETHLNWIHRAKEILEHWNRVLSEIQHTWNNSEFYATSELPAELLEIPQHVRERAFTIREGIDTLERWQGPVGKAPPSWLRNDWDEDDWYGEPAIRGAFLATVFETLFGKLVYLYNKAREFEPYPNCRSLAEHVLGVNYRDLDELPPCDEVRRKLRNLPGDGS